MTVALQVQFPRLSLKQRRFVEHLVRTANPSEAVEHAGYKSKHPAKLASQLRVKPAVAAAIEARMKEELEAVGVESHRILKELAYIGMADPAQLFATAKHVQEGQAKSVGELLSIGHMPEPMRRALSSIEVEGLYDADGNWKGFTTKVKMWNKVDALEKLGKYFKLWTEAAQAANITNNINALPGSQVNVASGVLVLPALKD